MNYLVTGGAGAGKSLHAATLVSGNVTCIIPSNGGIESDEWSPGERLIGSSRPADWAVLETEDVVAAIAEADGPVVLDCLGLWISGLISGLSGWEQPEDDWVPKIREQVEILAQAIELHSQDVVIITNEVGMGLVPEVRAGRLLRDLLGWANQRMGLDVDEVHLVVAGRALVL